MSRSWPRLLLTAAFTAALLLVVAALGQVPFGRASGRATLRLALRTVQGKFEVCRDRSAAELEELPVHMRQPRTCDELAPPYRLRLALDGRPLIDQRFAPGGLRGDRPIIVDQRLEHPAGPARVEVRFEPVLDDTGRRALAAAGAVLPHYRFDRTIDLPPDRITLIQLDEAAGSLELYRDPSAGP